WRVGSMSRCRRSGSASACNASKPADPEAPCARGLVELNQRLATLRAALGFLALEPRAPELRLLHNCFDTWRGIGAIVAGMARQEYDFELRSYNGQGWRAMFFESGFEHSLTSHAGAAWARSPCVAVQRAAGDAMMGPFLCPFAGAHRRRKCSLCHAGGSF